MTECRRKCVFVLYRLAIIRADRDRLETLLEEKDEPATEAKCSSSIQAVGELSMKATPAVILQNMSQLKRQEFATIKPSTTFRLKEWTS